MLNLEEFNIEKITDIYEKLQIDICIDIIEKLDKVDFTYTEAQIKALASINGKKIFYDTLDKLSSLTREQKEELKKLYERAMKDDLSTYKTLYKYKDKELSLNATQLRILNQGLKETNNTFKNLSKTIAFASEQKYVEAVDKAYMQVISGGIDYNTAIYNTSKQLAEEGVQLKDSAGRNIQLDVAVRRNVLDGIQQTANTINRDIEKELGCNGYEVSAHSGARPSHAEAQGKQYAIKLKDAQKYSLELWSSVEELWQEPNCRHTYYGIILGISEPVYDEKELKEMANANVTYDGKNIPLYEAYQKQRYYERNIRAKKRALESLKATNKDTKKVSKELKEYMSKYTEYSKKTNLDIRYDLIKI